eukprot:Blabericola_migrator_1__12844@NODE_832_length_6348_cov_238_992039_g587_i0_p1_GENE_NODE_832_length_6348_cov_238_992039_g587_i0NODE_832_length_6348_cov_238_992039_g587_i0_p1_ORF_typecomplete_len406_score61_92_NODE_832_length_6348_cov_238_992039_g587_i011492366
MPAYIASLVAVCIATSFTASANEDQQVATPVQPLLPSNPPIAYLVATPLNTGLTIPSAADLRRASRARAPRQQSATTLRGAPYVQSGETIPVEGFAHDLAHQHDAPQTLSRVSPARRSTRQRNELSRNSDLPSLTPTQLRDLKHFIHLASQHSGAGPMSPFLAPIVPITADDLAKIEAYLASVNAAAEHKDTPTPPPEPPVEQPPHEEQPDARATTVIDRPVFVDRQGGGPLVIIQQHGSSATAQVVDPENDLAVDLPTSDSGAVLADGDGTEYVPFAVIDRNGRVAILEKNQSAKTQADAPSETPEVRPAAVEPAPAPALKQLPAAIRKQLEEGRLMNQAPSYGSAPPIRSQIPYGDAKEFYLAPAYRPSQAQGQEFEDIARLMARSPAPQRRAEEIQNFSADQ